MVVHLIDRVVSRCHTVRSMPTCAVLKDNCQDACSFLDGAGRPMPPCIVMERGESLDMWARRNNRDMDQFTCMQVLLSCYYMHEVNLDTVLS